MEEYSVSYKNPKKNKLYWMNITASTINDVIKYSPKYCIINDVKYYAYGISKGFAPKNKYTIFI